MKIKWSAAIIAAILIMPLFGACSGTPASPTTDTTTPGQTYGLTQQESQQIALDFLTDSPTFRFDGMSDTVKLVDTLVLR